MTVGSHTVTHRALPISTNERREVAARLKARARRPPRATVADFCAPYGKPGISYLPERDTALATEEGYRSFATTVRGSMWHGDSPY